jgi:hypothetical protein
MQQPERLSRNDHLWNAFNYLSFPIHMALLLWFWVSINTRRQSKDRSFATPRALLVEANSAPPGYACIELWRYGVATCGGMVLRKIRGGKRTREATIYVSSHQHWQADRTLRAAGWIVLTLPVRDAKRGDSAKSAQSGPWRAWGVQAKPAGGHHALLETAARWLGLVD